MKQATEDKAVVPIYYEPRLAKLHLGKIVTRAIYTHILRPKLL
ncbi:hypothetical protein [Rufibacter quisquiliarum]